VEIPRWVAEDAGLLEFTQAVIYDQCQRGRGYPSALQEAHEQAVIGGDERRAVELLLEEALMRHQIVPRRSGKDGSKRGRFIWRAGPDTVRRDHRDEHGAGLGRE